MKDYISCSQETERLHLHLFLRSISATGPRQTLEARKPMLMTETTVRNQDIVIEKKP